MRIVARPITQWNGQKLAELGLSPRLTSDIVMRPVQAKPSSISSRVGKGKGRRAVHSPTGENWNAPSPVTAVDNRPKSLVKWASSLHRLKSRARAERNSCG
jgi:hypothetical protein